MNVPLDCMVKVPCCGCVTIPVTVSGSLSISESLANTEVALDVVVVTVPPSSTAITSTCPTGGSF